MDPAMIIKSMARKQPSFRQLIDYFDRGHDRDTGLTFARNFYDDPHQRVMVAKAFERNHAHLPKRANGNALYHEVIVLERQDGLSDTRQAELLLDLAERYCAKRAPNQLAYGRIHQDRDHHHIHLMISSNAVRSDRRVRMTKSQFAEIQRELERYRLDRFPELGDLRIYNPDPAREQSRWPSQRESLRETLTGLFENARSERVLLDDVLAAGYRFYRHGHQIGVEHLATGRRHRLRSLGLEAAYAEAFQRVRTERPAPDLAKSKDKSQPYHSAPVKAQRQPKAQPERQMAPDDPRAEALLRRRQSMERVAEDRLRRFDLERE